MRARLVNGKHVRVDHFINCLPANFIVFTILSLPRSICTINGRGRGSARILNRDRRRITRVLKLSNETFKVGFICACRSPSSTYRVLTVSLLRFRDNTDTTTRKIIRRRPRSEDALRSSFFHCGSDHLRVFSSKVRARCVALSAIILCDVSGVYFRLFTIPLLRNFSKGLRRFTMRQRRWVFLFSDRGFVDFRGHPCFVLREWIFSSFS